MDWRRPRHWVAVGFAWGLGLACDGGRQGEPNRADVPQVYSPERDDSTPTLRRPEPAGWRLADTWELEQVVLWVSHLLIRHRDAESEVALNLAEWTVAPPAPDRSRAQALRITEDLLARARAGADFAALARAHSEDLTTRDRGGSIGGVPASHLLPWPGVLDAVAATAAEAVSEIVETPYGFHLFYRHAPPRQEWIGGTHIVLGHRKAPWLRYALRLQHDLTRSHEDAIELAREVRERALLQENFSDLVERYSDHRDAERGGDLGDWSTWEPASVPRELDVLRRLRVGEVSQPFETALGVQIVQRTESSHRPERAMTVIAIPFDGALPPDQPLSKEYQRLGGESLLSNLLREPGRFEEVQRKLNAANAVEYWRQGRGPWGLEPMIEGLAPDQIAPKLAELDGTWLIVKRIDPERVPRPPVRFELPSPETQSRDVRA